MPRENRKRGRTRKRGEEDGDDSGSVPNKSFKDAKGKRVWGAVPGGERVEEGIDDGAGGDEGDGNGVGGGLGEGGWSQGFEDGLTGGEDFVALEGFGSYPVGGRPVEGDEEQWPEIDPDTKAYWKGVDDRIKELEDLGVGRRTRDEEGDDEEEEDDRHLLLRSSLRELSGHETELATDPETSVILERLLHSMDDFAKRVLADRFVGQYVGLSKQRYASHVLQTLFELGAKTVERELKGNVAKGPADGEDQGELPTMTDLIISAVQETIPSLPTLIFDPFSSHIIRLFLIILSGKPIESSQIRSKKSTKFKSKQGKFKSFVPTGVPTDLSSQTALTSTTTPAPRPLPKSFKQTFELILTALTDTVLSNPNEARSAAVDVSAGPIVGLVLELEAERKSWKEGCLKVGGVWDRVGDGLVEAFCKDPDSTSPAQRSPYLDTILRSSTSSFLFETLLSSSPPPLFQYIWSTYFKDRSAKLAHHPVTNFVVAKGIERLDDVGLKGFVREMGLLGGGGGGGGGGEEGGKGTRKVGSGGGLGEGEGSGNGWVLCLVNERTGSVKAAIDRSVALGACQEEISKALMQAFEIHSEREEEIKFLVPCVCSLHRFQIFRKAHNPEEAKIYVNVQGTLLVQSWLRMSQPHNQAIINSIHNLPSSLLMPFLKNPSSSRIVDVFLESPPTSVPPKEKRKFMTSLIGKYHELADDRIGSRLAEKIWETADGFLKEKIAGSLTQHQNFLQASAFGHYFLRKLQLPLFQRDRDQWKFRMTTAPAPPPVPPPHVPLAQITNPAAAAKPAGTEEPKDEKKSKIKKDKKARGEAKRDEIDDVFDRALKSKKTKGKKAIVQEDDVMELDDTAAEYDGDRNAVKSNGGMEDLKDVLGAIRESVGEAGGGGKVGKKRKKDKASVK